MFFVNDTSNWKRFQLVYDPKTTVYNVYAELNYQMSEKMRLAFTADYLKYKLEKEQQAWHSPSLKLNITATYNIGNKIYLKGDIFTFDHTFAKVPVHVNPKGEVRLKGIIDANIEIRYKYSRYLSIFARINNIANTKYERWFGYPSFGLNGLLGVDLTL